MFEYLEKFKKLAPDLQQAVSSPAAVSAISALEKKYGVDLDVLVIKIMVKDVAWPDLESFLAQEHNLDRAQAKTLQDELGRNVFYGVKKYLGIQPAAQSHMPPSKSALTDIDNKLKQDLTTNASSKPVMSGVPTMPPAVASLDEQADGVLNKVLEQVQISDANGPEGTRLKSAVKTFLKGIRDILDTRDILTKPRAQGGLALSSAQANAIITLLKQAKDPGSHPSPTLPTGKVRPSVPSTASQNKNLGSTTSPMPSLGGRKSPFDALEQVRDVEYQFELKAPRPFAKIAPPPPVVVPAEKPVSTPTQPVQPKPAFVISPEKVKQAEQAVTKTNSEVTKPARRASDIFADSAARNRAGESRRSRMDDIFQPPTRLQGPVEELAGIDLTVFRRLGDSVPSITGKIVNKIKLLEQESFTKRQQGVNAWRHSPVYGQYLALGQESFNSAKPVEEIIAGKQKDGLETLTVSEFEAIAELNQSLRV